MDVRLGASQTWAMDVIAAWLSAARVKGTVYARTELGDRWGLTFPAAPRITFHLLTRGHGTLVVEGSREVIELAPGDLVLLASGRQHHLASSSTEACTDIMAVLGRQALGPGRVLKLSDEPQTILICGAYSLDPANARAVLSLLPPVVLLRAHEAKESAVPGTLALLTQEMQGSAPAELVTSRLVDLLLVYVLRAWAQTRPKTDVGWLSALRDPQLAGALGRVHAEPDRPWTVESLAALAGMSRAAFARRFTLAVGDSPLAYITRWRLALAARLLADTPLGLANIATRVGYTSEYAFNRAFARAYGQPPRQWRTAIQK